MLENEGELFVSISRNLMEGLGTQTGKFIRIVALEFSNNFRKIPVKVYTLFHSENIVVD